MRFLDKQMHNPSYKKLIDIIITNSLMWYKCKRHCKSTLQLDKQMQNTNKKF